MQMTPAFEVLAKYAEGAYHTQVLQGRRASSTVSATQAVQRLGRKLWGYEPVVELVELRLGACVVLLVPQPAHPPSHPKPNHPAKRLS